MALIPITPSAKTGTSFDPTTTQIDYGGGDTFANNSNVLLLFFNNAGGPITITITSVLTIRGLAVQDPALILAAGDYGIMGPYPAADFNDANGVTSIAYSGGVTDVYVTAIGY